MIKDKILALAGDVHDTVVSYRKHLHMHPELSFEEKETGLFIASQLKEAGVDFTDGWAGHGIVGIIEGNKPDSRVVALRADIDALPIREQNEVDYKSQNEGVMHACGHDVHTSSLLGVAIILSKLKSSFDGTVKLIFQPGEERMPGGASIMIKEGVLKNPVPQRIYGQHVHPPLRAGHVGFRPGKYMASADEIELVVRGRGGHGALPHTAVDPVVVSSQIVSALQTVVSRSANPTVPSVLTFGKIRSEGGTYNVIPESVELLGTFRTFDEDWRKRAHQQIRQIATGIAAAMGAECDVLINVGYPYLENHPSLTEQSKSLATELLGAEYVHDLPMRMTAEDFSYYSHELPGCFYRLGISNPEKGITSSVHTPTFDIDHLALKTGPALMAWLAVAGGE